MKIFIYALPVFFVYAGALAQVNLDQRISVSRHDQIYASSSETQVVYIFPNGLNRLSFVRVSRDGDRLVAHFEVGVPESEFQRVDALLRANGKPNQKAMVLRALEAYVIPESGTDIPKEFKPIIKVAGDARNITGPIRYSLSLRDVKRKGKSETLPFMAQLFGSSGADHIANVRVQFNAIAMGLPRSARTTIGIFVGTANTANRWNPDRIIQNIKLVEDHESRCWEQPAPGTICLR